jgi:hypothetical protein
MTKTQIQNSVEFVRLQKAIKSTLIEITYSSLMRRSYDERYSDVLIRLSISDDIDTAFSAISNCFEDFGSICDTMCRDYAKSEVNDLVNKCITIKNQDKLFNECVFIEENIDCEDIFQDILDMNADDETDEVS